MVHSPGMDLPARIGRYEVIRLLGQGGMGRVLLAKDSVLGRHVAIKILRDDLGLPPESRDALFARMQQEARAVAAIEHPHLVTLHDMGEEPSVGLYLVFEYLDRALRCATRSPKGRSTLSSSGGWRASSATRSPRRMKPASSIGT